MGLRSPNQRKRKQRKCVHLPRNLYIAVLKSHTHGVITWPQLAAREIGRYIVNVLFLSCPLLAAREAASYVLGLKFIHTEKKKKKRIPGDDQASFAELYHSSTDSGLAVHNTVHNIHLVTSILQEAVQAPKISCLGKDGWRS